jgi:maleylpyruvate isomerase
MTKLALYSYFRSSAAYRVRIALNLKGLAYDIVPVHLLKDGGQQHQLPYRRINPAGLVPALVLTESAEDTATVLHQSLAIIEYLDERYPTPPLLPDTELERAQVRAFAQQVACDIHPLNNLRVLNYLKQLGVAEGARDQWYRHWVETGFTALETHIARHACAGPFAFGETPTVADICLIPQVYNALRFHVDMKAFPTLQRIYEHALTFDAFVQAAPDAQPDAL